MAPGEGVEPPTFRVTTERSATELLRNKMEGRAGFEPAESFV